MPWHLEKSGSGYYVVTTSTGRKHSKEPLPKARAEAQLKALQINADKRSSQMAKGPLDAYRGRRKKD
jgi:hypothetical protein